MSIAESVAVALLARPSIVCIAVAWLDDSGGPNSGSPSSAPLLTPSANKLGGSSPEQFIFLPPLKGNQLQTSIDGRKTCVRVCVQCAVCSGVIVCSGRGRVYRCFRTVRMQLRVFSYFHKKMVPNGKQMVK